MEATRYKMDSLTCVIEKTFTEIVANYCGEAIISSNKGKQRTQGARPC